MNLISWFVRMETAQLLLYIMCWGYVLMLECLVSVWASLCITHWLCVTVWYEPTCLSKAARQFLSDSNCFPTYFFSPNLSELRAIYHQVTGEAVSTTHIAGKCVFLLIILDTVQYGIFHGRYSERWEIDEVFHLSRQLLPLVPHLLVSLGKDGMAYKDSRGVLYPPAPEEMLPVDVISVTGAGDR